MERVEDDTRTVLYVRGRNDCDRARRERRRECGPPCRILKGRDARSDLAVANDVWVGLEGRLAEAGFVGQ